MGGFPLSRNFTCVYTHKIFNHVNKVEASEQEHVLSHIASISTQTYGYI